MTIIDRYLLRQFLRTFAICFISLTGLYIVFDAFTNLEQFLRCAEKSGGLFSLLGTFYGYKSVAFFNRTAGLLTLVAATFTISWFQRYNEMTALMSAGISRIRVIMPVIVAAIVVTLLATANRELIIPRISDQLARTPQNPLGDVGRPLQPRYDYRTDVLIRGKMAYADQQRIVGPDFLLPPALADYGEQLVAKKAFYQPPQGDRPGGYLLDGVGQPKHLDEKPSLRLGNEPVLITPHDEPEWLQPGQCFVVSQVNFDQLTGGRTFRQFASTAQLIANLRNPSLDFGADLRVTIHSRIVNPFLDVTLLFLGLPLVVSRGNRNVFLSIGTCVGVVTVFLMTVIGFQYLGSIYLLDPALAAWAPLILFVPPAVGLAESMWR